MRKEENKAVLAAMAACAGVCFSSGREIVLFFAQLGYASWFGIALSCTIFALLMAAVRSLSRRTGASGISEIYMNVLGSTKGTSVNALHRILLAMVSGMTLAESGKSGMLALPFHNAFWTGVLLTLIIALLLNMKNAALLPMAGLTVVLLSGSFYIALLIDPRPVTIHLSYVTVPKLSGSVPAAILLACLHAALCASVAGGTAARFVHGCDHPMRFGVKCGILMLAMLSACNGAILRGGERLLSLMYPTAVLAARWGTAGYYMSIAVMWLCSVSTLTAVIGNFRKNQDG